MNKDTISITLAGIFTLLAIVGSAIVLGALLEVLIV